MKCAFPRTVNDKREEEVGRALSDCDGGNTNICHGDSFSDANRQTATVFITIFYRLCVALRWVAICSFRCVSLSHYRAILMCHPQSLDRFLYRCARLSVSQCTRVARLGRPTAAWVVGAMVKNEGGRKQNFHNIWGSRSRPPPAPRGGMGRVLTMMTGFFRNAYSWHDELRLVMEGRGSFSF